MTATKRPTGASAAPAIRREVLRAGAIGAAGAALAGGVGAAGAGAMGSVGAATTSAGSATASFGVGLESYLGQHIVGQEHVIDAVGVAIRRWATTPATSGTAGTPLGSFLFLGPTRVGKTELVKRVAEFLHRTSDAMVRVNMRDFATRESDGQLTETLGGALGGTSSRGSNPAPRVLLLDEIERAHPEALATVTRLLNGTPALPGLRDLIVVMTANVAPARLTHALPTDLLSRVGETVTFHPLTPAQIDQVVGMMQRSGRRPHASN